MLAFEEAITFLVSLTFVWFEVSQVSVSEFRGYYEKNKSKVWPQVPGWLFGVVWFAIKVMIVLAMFFYLRGNTSVSVAIFALWVVNEMLRKYWTYFFMDMKQTGMAFFVCLGILGTGLGVLILLAIDQYWLPFGLLVFYNVWVAFACILSLQWWRRVGSRSRTPMVADTQIPLVPPATTSSGLRVSRMKK